MEKRVLIIILICLLVGFLLGWTIGIYQALGWAIEKADYFLSAQGINISINGQVIASEIWRYRNNIGAC